MFGSGFGVDNTIILTSPMAAIGVTLTCSYQLQRRGARSCKVTPLLVTNLPRQLSSGLLAGGSPLPGELFQFWNKTRFLGGFTPGRLVTQVLFTAQKGAPARRERNLGGTRRVGPTLSMALRAEGYY